MGRKPNAQHLVVWTLLCQIAFTFAFFAFESDAQAQDIDFTPYMTEMQRRIKQAWFPPKLNEYMRTIVVFKVHKNGEVTDLKLVTSSKNKIADDIALKAVDRASPFKPLPLGAPGDVDIQFTFDYNPLDRVRFGTPSVDKEELEKWQNVLMANPYSVEARSNVIEILTNSGNNQDSQFLLEEGENIMPDYQKLKSELDSQRKLDELRKLGGRTVTFGAGVQKP